MTAGFGAISVNSRMWMYMKQSFMKRKNMDTTGKDLHQYEVWGFILQQDG